MSASIRSADQSTHIKIVVVSLLAAIVVVAIGIGSRNFGIDVDHAVTKAGKPVSFTIKDIPTVR
jgi:hypothetical protein